MKSQIMFVIMLLVLAAPAALAKSDKNTDQQQPAATPAPAASPAVDKLDVSDLENKYWAPKDTDFSVVQNRTYTKEKKVFISAQFGPDLTGGNYLDGNDVSLTANYFLNERYGLELDYMKSYLHPNAAVGDLHGANGYPNFGIMQGYEGVGFNWVPFYSKMSFLGKKILYFDMAVTPTLGLTRYDQQTINGNSGQNAFTYGFEITQYYFFASHWAFRVDLKNQWWNQDVVQYKTDSVTGRATGASVETDHEREMIFLFGFTYFFGFGK